jgi:uncharacterized protein (TIGR03000 family)
MLQKVLSFGGMLILAGAAILWTAGPGLAAGHGGGGHGGGGGHFGGGYGGGGHFGGAHLGGYHGGYSHGGYSYGSGYHPYHGYGNYNRGYYSHYGYGYNRGYYPYYNSYYGYTPYYGSYPYYGNYPSAYSYEPDTSSTPTYQASGSALSSTSAYEPSGSALYAPPAAQPDSRVQLTMNVPADAEIWVEDSKTTQTGPVREFQSPPLTPGKRYLYEVRARWSENGHEVTQTQTIRVTAGAHVNVSFPLSSGSTTQPATGN